MTRDHLMLTQAGWSVTYAPSLGDATLVSESEDFDALVLVMTSISEGGEALLEHVRRHQPDCLRLVLADVATLDMAQALISKCHRILVSPCDPLSLETTLEHTRRLQDSLGRTGLRVLGTRRRLRDSRNPTGDLLSMV